KVSPTMMSPCSRPARNTMVSSRSHTGATPSRSISARRAMELPRAPSARGGLPLERLDEQFPDMDRELLLEFTDARGTRDVDLGDEAADDVESDEQHAARGERRSDLSGEPAVALVQRPAHPLGAGGEVAAMIIGGRDAGEGVGHRLPIDQQHAGIPADRDLRQVALRDGEA